MLAIIAEKQLCSHVEIAGIYVVIVMSVELIFVSIALQILMQIFL